MPTRSLYNDNGEIAGWLESTARGDESSQNMPGSRRSRTQSDVSTSHSGTASITNNTSRHTTRHEPNPMADLFDTLISIPHRVPQMFHEDKIRKSWPAFAKDAEDMAVVLKSREEFTSMKSIVMNTTIGGGPMGVTFNRVSLHEAGRGRDLMSVMFFLSIEMGRNCTNLSKEYREGKHTAMDQAIIMKVQRPELSTVQGYLEDGEARQVHKFFGQSDSSGWLMYTASNPVIGLFETDFYTFYGLCEI
ncbi:hypothetical protein FFLO_06862 [Filobasidium floriforme]|uniref:Uncharacterized protein n=1 Tax=Filobasidium floriforme TaxID=5210 RepID=A0A8K0JE32_9TREE|nr:uncharacterized protein HD553DRAFT_340388 [Filobasidium floriforme]KAG7527516.1 hypothetical protein FFLO_06862 [Filobasidium floriforme]KAH8087226.1 hypothetical protein HD553DRAFT_340388 [Filobasidium floriforme]